MYVLKTIAMNRIEYSEDNNARINVLSVISIICDSPTLENCVFNKETQDIIPYK